MNQDKEVSPVESVDADYWDEWKGKRSGGPDDKNRGVVCVGDEVEGEQGERAGRGLQVDLQKSK